MRQLQWLEQSDRRIIAAIRCVDAVTNLQILAPLHLQAPGLKLIRNQSGYYILLQAPGFEEYIRNFVQPLNGIASVIVTLQVFDPSGRYLPRQAALQLPRNPDLAEAEEPSSIFQPVTLRLYPTAIAQTAPGWAVIRATVTDADTGDRLPWAVIRVTRTSDPEIDLMAQADWRGEVLVAVPGIPVTNWETAISPGRDAVTTIEVEATLDVIFDPSLQTIPATADLSTVPDPNPGYFPDPEALLARQTELRSGSLTYSLASGRDRAEQLAVTLT